MFCRGAIKIPAIDWLIDSKFHEDTNNPVCKLTRDLLQLALINVLIMCKFINIKFYEVVY